MQTVASVNCHLILCLAQVYQDQYLLLIHLPLPHLKILTMIRDILQGLVIVLDLLLAYQVQITNQNKFLLFVFYSYSKMRTS